MLVVVCVSAILHTVSAEYTAFMEEITDDELSTDGGTTPKRRLSRIDSFSNVEFHKTTLPVFSTPTFDCQWQGESLLHAMGYLCTVLTHN